MSDPIDGENPEQETGSGAVESGGAGGPGAGAGAGGAGAGAGVGAAELDAAVEAVPDFDVPEAVIPDPDVPEPSIPDAVIPESAFAEPVIPPAPFEMSTRSARRRTHVWDQAKSASTASAASGRTHPWDKESPVPAAGSPVDAVAPASDPRLTAPDPDPEVVPPASGATPTSYRGWTIAVFAFLLLLLIAAVVTIGVLLSTGSPFALAAPVSPALLLT